MKKPPKLGGNFPWCLNYRLKMKLSLLLFLTLGFVLQANSSYSQKTKISLDRESVMVKEVLDEIEASTEFKFIFNTKVVNLNRKVSIQVKKVPIDVVLDILFNNMDTSYEIEDRKILLRRSEPKNRPKVDQRTEIGTVPQFHITGTITDSKGVPLPGANVVEKGTTNGTTADFDGNFTLEPSDQNAILVFSYIGFGTKEVAIQGQSVLTIVLEESAAGLDEVVVTGYTSQVKGTLSSAISTVSSEELVAAPIANVSQGLQGRVPGVTVGSGSGPGGGISVRIRGYTTINNNDPLYIVDGVPLQGDLNLINPDDIESISVLKDASASIYGSRAAAGVILITTKSGKDGKVSLQFNSYSGMQAPPKLYKAATPYEQALIDYMAADNGGEARPPQYGTAGQQGGDPVLPDYLLGDPGQPYDIDNNKVTKANKAGTDWLGEIFDPAPIQNYQMSISGGSEKGNYLFSGGYFDQEGILQDTGFERVSARVNTNFNVTDHLRFGENIMVSYSQRNGYRYVGMDNNGSSPILQAMRAQRIVPIYDEGGFFSGTGAGALAQGGNNAVAILSRMKDDKSRLTSILGSAFMEFDFLGDFTFKTNIGINHSNVYNTGFVARAYETYSKSEINTLTETSAYSTNIDWFNTLSYSKSFGENNIKAFVGYEAIWDKSRNIMGQRQMFPYEDNHSKVLGAGTGSQFSDGGAADYVLLSLFGKLDYVYAGKYILSASLRHDASSRFVGSNRSELFPEFSAAWNISKEKFMEPLQDQINNLKIRASWGQMGGQGISNRYPTYDIYSSNVAIASYDISGANTGTTTGYYLQNKGNKDIGWEISTMTDIGLDLTLFDHALNFTFDWYKRTTTDILYNPVLPASAGFQAASPYQNIGDMTNTGIDFSLGYNGTKGDFEYDVSLNFSHYKNIVDRISDNDQAFVTGNPYGDQYPSRTQKGQPISSFYGYIVDGIFQNQAEVDAHAEQATKGIGRYRYRDVNGDGTINEKDRTFIGNPHPDFTYGLNIGLKYKNLDLGMFLQGSQGNDIFQATRYYTHNFILRGSRSTDLLYNSWTPDNRDAKFSQTASNASISSMEKQASTIYIEDGSYLRMKNIQLGYSFPDEVLKSIGLSKLRLYIQGQNLFTITKYTGMDPEVSSNTFYDDTADFDIGVDRGGYPPAITYLIGLNLSL